MKDDKYSIRKELSIKGFKGLDNKSDPSTLIDTTEKELSTYLSNAENVDFTKDNKIVMRRGWELSSSGSFHSLWQSNDTIFCVKNNYLGTLDNDLLFTPLIAATSAEFNYVETNAGIFMTDNSSIYRYYNGALESLIGEGSYSFSSIDIDITKDEEVYDKPIPGLVITWMFGRLWIANDEAIYYSRGYLPMEFNLSTDYIDIKNVTMIKPVSAGYYIGTEDNVLYISGGNPKQALSSIVCSEYGAIRGTSSVLPLEVFEEDKSGDVVIWESSQGKMIGYPNGDVIPLSFNRVSHPYSKVGSSFLKEFNGETHHISSLRNQNADGSNIRTSDIAVAEIVRNGIII